MPSTIIKRVNEIGLREKQGREFVFADRIRSAFPWNDEVAVDDDEFQGLLEEAPFPDVPADLPGVALEDEAADTPTDAVVDPPADDGAAAAAALANANLAPGVAHDDARDDREALVGSADGAVYETEIDVVIGPNGVIRAADEVYPRVETEPEENAAEEDDVPPPAAPAAEGLDDFATADAEPAPGTRGHGGTHRDLAGVWWAADHTTTLLHKCRCCTTDRAPPSSLRSPTTKLAGVSWGTDRKPRSKMGT